MDLPLVDAYEVDDVHAALAAVHAERDALTAELAELRRRIAEAQDRRDQADGALSVGERILHAASHAVDREGEIARAVDGLVAAAEAESALRIASARAEVARRNSAEAVAAVDGLGADRGAITSVIDLAERRSSEAM